jgi:ribose transport system permease protein
VGDWGLWIVFAVLLIVFGTLQPRFFSAGNFWNVVRQASPLALAAAGQAIVLIMGKLDLSVGAIAAMTSVIMVRAVWAYGVIPGTIIGIVVGGMLGALNGLIIGRWKLNALVATLATMTIIRGVAFYITGGVPLHGKIPPGMLIIGNGYVGPVPIPGIVAGVGFIFLYFFLYRTPMGRRIYAVGGNPEAARLAGMNLLSTTTVAFMITGLFAAMTGVILTSRLAVGAPNLGPMLNLESIAAAVIGGVSLFGGEGTVLGVILGTLLFSVIRNGLNLYNVSTFAQMIATGLGVARMVNYPAFKEKG